MRGGFTDSGQDGTLLADATNTDLLSGSEILGLKRSDPDVPVVMAAIPNQAIHTRSVSEQTLLLQCATCMSVS